MYQTPSILTKELKLQNLQGVGRRLRLSSNFLRGFGFEPETRINVSISHGGGVITPSATGDWKVHQRSYPQRKNNPTESVIELANQTILRQLVPVGYDRAHFTFLPGRIEVRPVKNTLFHIRKKFRQTEALHAFMALSSGLDAWVFRNAGFNLAAALEYRPPKLGTQPI